MNGNMNKGAAMFVSVVIGAAIGFVLSVTLGNPILVGAGIAVGIAVFLAYNGDH